jgi:hypothetical protein
VHRDDGSDDSGGQACALPVESAPRIARSTPLSTEEFECDKPIKLRLPRFVYGAHSALADQLNDFKLRETPRERIPNPAAFVFRKPR